MTESFIASTGNRSTSDNGRYVSFVESALNDYNIFSKFKQHPHYTEILEHVSEDQGRQFLEIIKEQTPKFFENINLFKINDLIGSPTICDYNGIKISPSTLRYVKVASDIAKFFGKYIGDKIVEIGTGYGGQYLILDKIYQFTKYHLFDLEPVLNLNKKYLESFCLNSSYKTSTLNQCSGEEEYDLVISNYAFSELPKHIQKKYIEKVLSKAKRGYLTMNTGLLSGQDNFLSVNELRGLLPEFEILEETPNTFHGNYLIVWGNKTI